MANPEELKPNPEVQLGFGLGTEIEVTLTGDMQQVLHPSYEQPVPTEAVLPADGDNVVFGPDGRPVVVDHTVANALGRGHYFREGSDHYVKRTRYQDSD